MSSRFIMPFADVGSGIKPSSGAKLFFFELDGVTPKDTFSDQLTVPTANANPVISDSTGVFSDIYIVGSYKVTLQNNQGSQIFGGAIVSEILEPVALPVADLVADYGAKGDAVYQYEVDGSVTVTSGTDDTQSLLDAMTDFASGAIGALTVPDGNFWIDSSQIDTPTGTSLIGAGSGATKFIMSTTTPNLNLFVGFYLNARVSNLHFSGFKIIGSKVDDNAVGGTGIFTFGTTGVTGWDLASEGSKGLIWMGEDNVVGGHLFGTKDVFLSNLRVDDCKLFSVYARGNEVPDGAALAINDTNNINIDGLIIRGSNVGFVSAEGRPRNIKIINYDCQDTDNLLQFEASDDIHITNYHMSNATSQWNAGSPAPAKNQWQISQSNDVHFVNGFIDAELQAFAFGILGSGCKNVTFDGLSTDELFRITTLNVQNGADTFLGLFSNWSFDNCDFPRDGTTFFQSDVADQAGLPLAYWRDWSWSDCSWSNNSASNPIVSVACVGSMVFDDKCTFNGKPPRALKGQKITFNATVRANGITGSDIQFTAVDGLETTDQTILRVGGNIQIEGEIKDVGFDITHANASVDSRNASPQCWTSDAVEFFDSGVSTYRFTGSDGIVSAGIGTYKELTIGALPSVAGQNTFITQYTGTGAALNVVTGGDATASDPLIILKYTGTGSWGWFDGVRGVTKYISSDLTAVQATQAQSLTTFNNDGFSLGTFADFNTNTSVYISYQLQKAEGFLDIVPDVGTAANKTIPHALVTDVGCIISNNLDAVSEWAIQYHTFNTASGAYIDFNNGGVLTDSTVWNDTAATDTEFSVGTSTLTNGSGNNIIHYLFAKSVCHSYSGNGLTTNVIDFGYKSKMVIIKRVTAATTGDFNIFDNVRDVPDVFTKKLGLNKDTFETTLIGAITITDTGIIINITDSEINAAGSSYILIAIPEI